MFFLLMPIKWFSDYDERNQIKSGKLVYVEIVILKPLITYKNLRIQATYWTE